MSYGYISYNYVTHAAAGVDDPSWAVDIGTRTNGFLVFGVFCYLDKILDATYNSVSMTLVTKDSDAANGFMHLFCLENPSNGSNQLAIDSSGTVQNLRTALAWYDGGKQTSPIHLSSQYAEAATGDPTITMVPTVDNTLVTAFEHNAENIDPTIVTGNEIYSVYNTGRATAMSYVIQTTAGSQVLDWDVTAEIDEWQMSGGSFLEAAAGGLPGRRMPRGVLRGVVRGSI